MNPPSDRRWRDEATCREVDAALFFPEPGANPTAARRVCAVCPVRTQCLTDAFDRRDIAYGVLGGLTPRERRELLHHHTTTASVKADPVRSAA
ncbi:MAG: WhiB family transcriptional regulator [Actinomycetota bacterium]|nr:WhiB family transcriptional regulator [Actinomycetota bacterium]